MDYNNYGSLNDKCRTNIFCMNQDNKYISFIDQKQTLNIYSSNYNNNDQYRFKKTLHTFKDNSVCCDIKTFDNKIMGVLCDKYILFYKCSV